MAKKVFISYAHKDEEFKESLVEHMAGLIRAEIINEWNDRKIMPSQDWSNEISENLESSELILFLISSSFMNSEYCMGVEVKRALQMHKEGKAQLIPIVVRAVDWTDSDLSKLQGLPKDAKPISSWADIDEAWVNVIGGIKNFLKEFKPKPIAIKSVISSGVVTTEKINLWLNDTEIVLTHRKVNQVKLDDIYVIPDIEIEKSNELVDIKSARFLLQNLSSYIISGEEQQGKTSLLKYLYKELLKKSFLPLYIDATSIKKSSSEHEVSKALVEQYQNLTFEDFKNNQKAVILIDNIDAVSYTHLTLPTILLV